MGPTQRKDAGKAGAGEAQRLPIGVLFPACLNPSPSGETPDPAGVRATKLWVQRETGGLPLEFQSTWG